MPLPPSLPVAEPQPGKRAEFDVRRAELAQRIAGIVLADGLEALSLRGLADKCDTSGRMLLYYFETKDALVVATLAEVSAQLGALLEGRVPEEKLTAGAFLSRALATSADPAIAPFVRVWTEVIARAARGEAPYRQVAGEIVERWVSWIENQLAPDNDTGNRARAAAILAIVEGSLLLEGAAPGTTRGAMAWLSSALDGDIYGGKLSRRF